MPVVIFLLFFCFLPKPLYAWSGYDWEKGSFVEIDKGQLVREGETVEVFDYGSSDYRNIDIESMDRIGNSVEIIGRDSETGEPRTFDMD